MKFTQIKETCICCRNLEIAREFYHVKLGLPIIGYVESKHIFLSAGNSVLLCFKLDDSKTTQSPPAHYAEGKYYFAFEVDAEDYECERKK
jgi:catechol-2,3-dioxygenase